MHDQNVYLVSTRRLAGGTVVAAFVPVVVSTALTGHMWSLALVVAAPYAVVVAIIFAWPYVLWLRRTGRLKISWILTYASLLAVVPDTLMSLYFVYGGSMLTLVSDEYMVMDGKLTLAGFAYLFILRPGAYALAGAADGLIFWLIAVGRRLEAPKRPSNNRNQATPKSGAPDA